MVKLQLNSLMMLLTPIVLLLLLTTTLVPNEVKGEWDTFHGDATRTGWSECNWVEGDVLWVSDAENGYIDSSPVHGGDKVFVVSSGERGSDAAIHCMDVNDGSFIWNTTIPGKGYQLSTPVIVDDRLFLGSTTGVFYCLLIETGEIDWQRIIDPSPNGTTSSPAYGETSDALYIGTGDGYLYALETGSGNTIWRFDTGSSIYFSSPTVHGDTIYIGNDDGILFAVKQGIEEWRFQTGGRIRSSAVVGDDGHIYLSSEDGILRCLDSEGNEQWQQEIGASTSSPSVSDRSVMVGSNDGLFAFSLEGNELFSLDTNGPVDSSPCISDDQIFFTVNDQPGELICMDIDGDVQWIHSLEERVLSSPSIHNNTICIPSDSGKIWCFYSTYPASLELMVDPLPELKEGKGNITFSGGLFYDTGRPAVESTISIFIGPWDQSSNEAVESGNGTDTTGNGRSDGKGNDRGDGNGSNNGNYQYNTLNMIAQCLVNNNGSFLTSIENDLDPGDYIILIRGSDTNLNTDTILKLVIVKDDRMKDEEDEFIPSWHTIDLISSICVSSLVILSRRKRVNEHVKLIAIQ